MAKMECCGEVHLFDSLAVGTDWVPRKLACLFLGENPGTPGSPHFYTPMPAYKADPIEVRRYLLPALSNKKIISSPTLEDFRDKGFLFDHAIRCQLATDIIREQASLAKEHSSHLAHSATHLAPLLKEYPRVWIMGYMALDAVTYFSQDNLPYIFDIPNYGRVINKKYFLPHYFNRFTSPEKINNIVEKFEAFLSN